MDLDSFLLAIATLCGVIALILYLYLLFRKKPTPTLEGPKKESQRAGASFFQELETSLLKSDLGLKTTRELLDALQEHRDESPERVLEELRNLLTRRSLPYLKREWAIPPGAVLFLVGSNGTGKTTSAAKIALHLKREKGTVALATADTFRAAASEQLERLARTLELPFFPLEKHRDPRARVYAAIEEAQRRNATLVLDTGGRNPKDEGLMRELSAMLETGRKAHGQEIEERWLVLDAHQGMIALDLVEAFHRSVNLTGIFVAKWDSVSGGGFLYPLWERFPIPVVGFGVGEKPEDLLLPSPELLLKKLLSKHGA